MRHFSSFMTSVAAAVIIVVVGVIVVVVSSVFPELSRDVLASRAAKTSSKNIRLKKHLMLVFGKNWGKIEQRRHTFVEIAYKII